MSTSRPRRDPDRVRDRPSRDAAHSRPALVDSVTGTIHDSSSRMCTCRGCRHKLHPDPRTCGRCAPGLTPDQARLRGTALSTRASRSATGRRLGFGVRAREAGLHRGLTALSQRRSRSPTPVRCARPGCPLAGQSISTPRERNALAQVPSYAYPHEQYYETTDVTRAGRSAPTTVRVRDVLGAAVQAGLVVPRAIDRPNHIAHATSRARSSRRRDVANRTPHVDPGRTAQRRSDVVEQHDMRNEPPGWDPGCESPPLLDAGRGARTHPSRARCHPISMPPRHSHVRRTAREAGEGTH